MNEEDFKVVDRNNKHSDIVFNGLDEKLKELDREDKDLKVALTVSVVILCVLSFGFLSFISQV